MKLLRHIMAAFDTTIHILIYLSIGLLVFAWVSVCAEIVMRYFFNHPLVWVVEICEYILLYITFLGSTWLLKNEGHVVIDIVPVFLGPRNEAMLNIITSILGAISCFALSWFAAQSTWDLFLRGVYDLKFLETPLAFVLAPIPIGSFLLSIQFLRRAHNYMERWRNAKNGVQVLKLKP